MTDPVSGAGESARVRAREIAGRCARHFSQSYHWCCVECVAAALDAVARERDEAVVHPEAGNQREPGWTWRDESAALRERVAGLEAALRDVLAYTSLEDLMNRVHAARATLGEQSMNI